MLIFYISKTQNFFTYIGGSTMKFTSKSRSVNSIKKDIIRGKFNFDSPLQREDNQYSNEGKSLLIDSMIRGIPLDPIRVIDRGDYLEVIDGKQRLTIISSFVVDADTNTNKKKNGEKPKRGFKLSRKLEPVTISGVEYEIAGKRFDQLDEVLKDIIIDFEIITYTFTECTREDIIRMFVRQNNGKPLNSRQKRTAIGTDEFNNIIFELTNHPFVTKTTTPTMRKGSAHREAIIQTLMLMETNNENDYTSFKQADVDSFILQYPNGIDERKISALKSALDSLNEVSNNFKIEKELEKGEKGVIKMPITLLPFILYSSYRVKKDAKSFSKLAEKMADFVKNYDNQVEYKSMLGGGTTDRNSVRKRLDYWRNVIRTL